MDGFLDFLVNNWQFISTAILTVLSVILLIVKKRPLTEILDNSSYRDLIDLVNEAEELYGSKEGYKKLDYVIKAYCNRKNLPISSLTSDAIQFLVEQILETPQKKGVEDGKKS